MYGKEKKDSKRKQREKKLLKNRLTVVKQLYNKHNCSHDFSYNNHSSM